MTDKVISMEEFLATKRALKEPDNTNGFRISAEGKEKYVAVALWLLHEHILPGVVHDLNPVDHSNLAIQVYINVENMVDQGIIYLEEESFNYLEDVVDVIAKAFITMINNDKDYTGGEDE